MSRVHVKSLLLLMLTIVLSGGAILGQTSGFNYQGRLTDGGMPANGNYDLQFALFDAADGTNQIGQTKIVSSVPVSAGIFTVTLDFGANAFSGANRFLEISARPSGAGSFSLLTPRQPITSTPYAVRSSSTASADNAQQLAGVAASQYVKTDDARMSDARDPKAGNSNYVQNSTSLQAATNFNVSGNGTVGGLLSGNAVNAVTQYNLAGQRVLGVGVSDNALRLGGLGSIYIDGPGQSRFRVEDNGNVGIGTVPGSKLTVQGTVESRSGGFKFPDASVQTNAVGRTFTGSTNVEFEILHNDNFGTIISTAPIVPPGVYLLTATAAFENKANGFLQNNTRVVRCFLGNDLSVIGLGAPGSATEFATLTVHTVFTQPVESQISFSCGSRDGVGQVFVKARRVTAIRVGDNPQ